MATRSVVVAHDPLGRPVRKLVHQPATRVQPHQVARQEKESRRDHISMAYYAHSAQIRPANEFNEQAAQIGATNLVKRAQWEGWSRQEMRQNIPNSLSSDPEIRKIPDTPLQRAYHASETAAAIRNGGVTDPNAAHRRWLADRAVMASNYTPSQRIRMGKTLTSMVRGELTPQEHRFLQQNKTPEALLHVAKARGY